MVDLPFHVVADRVEVTVFAPLGGAVYRVIRGVLNFNSDVALAEHVDLVRRVNVPHPRRQRCRQCRAGCWFLLAMVNLSSSLWRPVS